MFTAPEIRQLVSEFENRTLNKNLWTHEAHLVIALWYALHYDMEGGLKRLRKNISEYNTAVGTANTETSGYHETITKFWLRSVKTFVGNNKGADNTIEFLCSKLLKSEIAAKNYLLNFYTPKLLFSSKARANWVEPDLV